MNNDLFRLSAVAWLGLLPMLATAANGNFDKNFLTDYTKLQAKATDKGTDRMYMAPGVLERLAKYDGVMVDQPEILISPESDYKGAKPEDLAAIAGMMREGLSARLSAGGYNVVQAPGPGVIYVRLALTDLQLKKKKRGVLAYTPIGLVVKAGTDALKDMMDKYDVMNMVIQAELTDSQSNEMLAALVAERGGGEKPVRMDFDQLDAQMKDFGSRLRCRLDNARVPASQQIDCLDPQAREAAEAARP
ncbi:MAG: DUF3313 domain-containing protein [Gammaproteobacteria bacterium]|nr:DUF3313 domain-containing protein [Gammaproteobacteria bacterium]